jgi:hypothetical protein
MFRNLTDGARWDVFTSPDDFDYLTPEGRQRMEEYATSRYGALSFLQVPRGLGRRMYSNYDYKSGYGFFDRMREAGHYNDQLGAMFAAVDPYAEFQGVDITADQNRYNIPYYLVFRSEFQNTFSALWSQDEAKIRPTLYKAIDNANQVQDTAEIFWNVYIRGQDLIPGFAYPKPLPAQCVGAESPGGTNPPSCFLPAQNAGPANISLTWTSRIYGLYLGMALFRVNYDLDYAKANQVFKLGGGESFNVAAGYHTLEVQDPVVGHRYLAIEKDGAPANSTGAVRMINIARDYLTMVKDPTTCPLPQYLFLLGYTCMSADAANNAFLVEDRRKYWTENFQNATRDLDLQRGMYSIYGKAF